MRRRPCCLLARFALRIFHKARFLLVLVTLVLEDSLLLLLFWTRIMAFVGVVLLEKKDGLLDVDSPVSMAIATPVFVVASESMAKDSASIERNV